MQIWAYCPFFLRTVSLFWLCFSPLSPFPRVTVRKVGDRTPISKLRLSQSEDFWRESFSFEDFRVQKSSPQNGVITPSLGGYEDFEDFWETWDLGACVERWNPKKKIMARIFTETLQSLQVVRQFALKDWYNAIYRVRNSEDFGLQKSSLSLQKSSLSLQKSSLSLQKSSLSLQKG